jgi:hypothetical protein
VRGNCVSIFAKRIHLIGLIVAFRHTKLDRLPFRLQAPDFRRQGVCRLAGKRVGACDK